MQYNVIIIVLLINYELMFLTRSQGQHATQSARHRLIKKNSIQVILLSRDKILFMDANLRLNIRSHCIN